MDPARAADVAFDHGGVVERITIYINKSRIIHLPRNARDVLVSNSAIVDAVLRTARQTYLIGMSIGETNVLFFGDDGEQILDLEIRVERDVSDLQSAIDRLFPRARVQVESINENVVLTGHVPTPSMANKIMQLSDKFIAGPGGASEGSSKVLNMLTVDSAEQVLLKVKIAEMQRSAVKQFGINLTGGLQTSILGEVFNFAGGLSHPFSIAGSALSSSFFSAGANFVVDPLTGTASATGSDLLGGIIQAMEQSGLLRTLAEPNLTALSGEKADFLAGGEFPVPVSQNDGEVAIEYKKFGVALSFRPVVLSEGRISLQISTEVSERSAVGSFTISNSTTGTNLTIPGLKVRRANTTVELPSGGSLMMAGLIQDDLRQELNGTPWAKDIPLLGALFRSNDYRRSETELVVIVTPYVVRPTARQNLASPGEAFVPASDIDMDLFARLHSVYGYSSDRPAAERFQGQIGFIIE